MKKIIAVCFAFSLFFGGHALAQDAETAKKIDPNLPKEDITKEERIGSWRLICAKSNKDGQIGPERCITHQTIVITDERVEGNPPILDVKLQIDPSDAVKKRKVMIIRTPLGMMLPYGVRISVDGQEKGSAKFTTCLPTVLGCHAVVEVTSDLLAAFKKGSEAVFQYADVNRQAAPVKIKLDGFTKSVNMIK
ncbi:MAG: invasion associated locus B family protein [Pseudomonadota bacterium]